MKERRQNERMFQSSIELLLFCHHKLQTKSIETNPPAKSIIIYDYTTISRQNVKPTNSTEMKERKTSAVH